MGLTSALNTALNGLGLNETAIDISGNNIANASTNGFKSSKVLFETQLARTLSVGSAPDESIGSGGTNPKQIGLGASTSSIIRDFAQGGITTTTSPSDLAIEGDGFFILESGEGTYYTRDGSFQLNSLNQLVSNSGMRIQGYGVDDNFELTGNLTDVEIPLGDTRVAQQTRNMTIAGALRTADTADVGTQGSILLGDMLVDSSGGSTAITATTSLTSVFNGTTQLFNTGDEIDFAPDKGGRLRETTTYTVTGSDTVDDFLTFLRESLGIMHNSIGTQDIDGTIANDASGDPPGVDVVGGQIRIVGNVGDENDIDFGSTTFEKNGVSFSDLNFSKTQSADGESAYGSFTVFDSLGNPVDLKMTAVLESRTSSAAVYRYFFESFVDSDDDTAVASGTISFDSNGSVTGTAMRSISIDRQNGNAASMDIDVDLSNLSGIVAAGEESTVDLVFQDGSEPVALTTFNINESGVVNGVFDNGIIRTLGQIVLARFRNSQGLVEAGRSTFREGVGSGERLLRTPGNGGTGTVRSGAIELSNADVGRNLVDLIVAATNYRGNARVISSVQALVDELLILGR